MGDLKERMGCAVAGIAYPVLTILGVLIHVWTVVIAYKSSGPLAAIISLVLPGISAVYWFFKVWSHLGSVVNTYCAAVIIYVAAWILMGVASKLLDVE